MKKLSNHSAYEMKTIFTNGFLFTNPVLIGAMGICPVVAAGYTLQNGVCLAIMAIIILVPTCVISSLLFAKMPQYLRVPAIVLLSALLYVAAAEVVGLFFTGMPGKLGIYAPLLAVGSILITRADGFAVRHIVPAALVNAVANGLGFALVLCVGSAVRELIAYGTLWGRPVFEDYQQITGAAMPFFGFIVLGFLAAMGKSIRHGHEQRLAARGKGEKPA